MALLPEDVSAAQWAYLFNAITAESQAGGRLTSLKDVRKSAQLWTEQLPAAGVQIEKTEFLDYGQHRVTMRTVFLIIVCTESVPNVSGGTEIPANLDDAMAQLQALMSDGNGNGLSPVLRDPANFLLGGNAQRIHVIGTEYIPDIGAGETPQLLAYAYTRLWAERVVYF